MFAYPIFREARAPCAETLKAETDQAPLESKYYLFVWPGALCIQNSVVERITLTAQETIVPGDDITFLVHLYDNYFNRAAQGGELLDVLVKGASVSGQVLDYGNGIYKICCKLNDEETAGNAVRLETRCCKEGVVTVRQGENEWEEMWAELSEDHTFSLYTIRNGEQCMPATVTVRMHKARVTRGEEQHFNPNDFAHFEIEYKEDKADGNERTPKCLKLSCRRLEETLRWIALLRRVSVELEPQLHEPDYLGLNIAMQANTAIVGIGIRGIPLPGSPFSVGINIDRRLQRTSDCVTTTPSKKNSEPESTSIGLPPVAPPTSPPLLSDESLSIASNKSILAHHHRLAQQIIQNVAAETMASSNISPAHLNASSPEPRDSDATTEHDNGIEESIGDVNEHSSQKEITCPSSNSSLARPSLAIEDVEYSSVAADEDDFISTAYFTRPSVQTLHNATIKSAFMTYPSRLTPAQRRWRRQQRPRRPNAQQRPSRKRYRNLTSRPSFKITKFEGWDPLGSQIPDASSVHAEAARRARSRSPEWRKDRLPGSVRRTRSNSPSASRREKLIIWQKRKVTEPKQKKLIDSLQSRQTLPGQSDSQNDPVDRIRIAKRLMTEGYISRTLYEEIKEAIVNQLKHGSNRRTADNQEKPEEQSKEQNKNSENKNTMIDNLERIAKNGDDRHQLSATSTATLYGETVDMDESSSDKDAVLSDTDKNELNNSRVVKREFAGNYKARTYKRSREYNHHSTVHHNAPFKPTRGRISYFGPFPQSKNLDGVKHRIKSAKRKKFSSRNNKMKEHPKQKSEHLASGELKDSRPRPRISGKTKPIEFSSRVTQPTVSSKRHSQALEGPGSKPRKHSSMAIGRDPFKEGPGRDSFFDLYNEMSSSTTTVESITPAGTSPDGSDIAGTLQTGEDVTNGGRIPGGGAAAVAEKIRVQNWLSGLGLEHLYIKFADHGLLRLSSLEFLDHQDLKNLEISKAECDIILKAIEQYSSTTTELATNAVKEGLQPSNSRKLFNSDDIMSAFAKAIDNENFVAVFQLWKDIVAPAQSELPKLDYQESVSVYFHLRVIASTTTSPAYSDSDRRIFLREFRLFLSTDIASDLLSREPSLLFLAGLPYVQDPSSHPKLQYVYEKLWRDDICSKAKVVLEKVCKERTNNSTLYSDESTASELFDRVDDSDRNENVGSEQKRATDSVTSLTRDATPSETFLQAMEKLKLMESKAPLTTVPSDAADSPAVRAINKLFRSRLPGARPPEIETGKLEGDLPPLFTENTEARVEWHRALDLHGIDTSPGGLDEIEDDDDTSDSSS